MKITTVTATAKYSKDLGCGAWKTIELGAEAAIGPNEDWQTAQQQLYHQMGQQIKTLWGEAKPAEPKPVEQERVPFEPDPPAKREHYCEEHQTEFKARKSQYGEFYSHQIQGTRTWCNEKKG